jgi:hypothetical protein
MLSEQQLVELISRPESEYLERKESLPNKREIRKTLVAFANSVPENEQAVLFIGVTDNGEIRGIVNSDRAQKDVRDAAGDCYPPVKFHTTMLSLGANNVLAVLVEASKDRPHFTGQAYIRKGSQSVQASKEVFDEMIAARNDKARAILRHRSELVTIQETNNPMAHLEKDGFGQSLIPVERRDYRINKCDAHCVELEDMNYRFIRVVPLAKVEISRSIVPPRLKLIVEGKLY